VRVEISLSSVIQGRFTDARLHPALMNALRQGRRFASFFQFQTALYWAKSRPQRFMGRGKPIPPPIAE
jgi:hypothetical protein